MPTKRNTLAGAIAVAAVYGLATLAATPAGAEPFAYVTNLADNSISVIDTDTNLVVDTIPLAAGANPGGVEVHPAGDTVYVANFGTATASAINTATNAVVATIPVGNSPVGVAVHPDGGTVYVANGLDSTVSVIETAGNSVVATIPVGGAPHGIAVHPDGGTVYTANTIANSVSVIDTATNAAVATIPIGLSPYAVAVSPDGGTVYATNTGGDSLSVIDAANNVVTVTVPVGDQPRGVAVHPDGGAVYVANAGDDSVSVVDTASNSVVAGIPVGSAPRGLAAHPDGGSVYVANPGSANVSVIDTASNSVVATIPVGSAPIGLGRFIDPDVGGAASGLTTVVAVCRNLTTGQAQNLFLQGDETWDCEADAGLVFSPDDLILSAVAGSVTGLAAVGASVTGIATNFALCRNLTTGQSANVPLQGDTMVDCEADGGLNVSPGQLALAAVVGNATPRTPKLVFVSSVTFATGGDVGQGLGAFGGDAHCQQLAQSAGHGGTFMAWLSGNTTSPAARFTKSTVPYEMVDGTLVAASYADLVDSSNLLNGILLDEFGVGQAGSTSWTGTEATGLPTADHCLNWTSSDMIYFGTAGVIGTPNAGFWSNGGRGRCSGPAVGPAHLYCFEQ